MSDETYSEKVRKDFQIAFGMKKRFFGICQHETKKETHIFDASGRCVLGGERFQMLKSFYF